MNARGISTAILVIGALMAVPASVSATTGVAVDLGRITLHEPLSAGTALTLPTMRVSNPGDEPASYTMGVGGIEGDDFAEPDDDWFVFSPVRFDLEPGAVRVVQLNLNLPPDAAVGSYAALVRAQLVTPDVGQTVGAAAAAEIRFDVAHGGPSSAPADEPAGADGGVRAGGIPGRSADGLAVLALISLMILTSLLLFLWLSRRYRLMRIR